MKKHARWCGLALLAAMVAALPLFSADPAVPDKPRGFPAITIPSKNITVSFVRPGRIVEMLVSLGDEVKEGQLVARLDDSEELAALAQDKLDAEDKTEIKAEETIHEQKVQDIQHLKDYGGSLAEYENAVLEEKIELAKIQIANTRHDKAMLKYEQSKIVVEKLKVRAPISGWVDQEFLKAGENAEGGNAKAVRIVQIDPLWAEVPVPLLQARKLKEGDPAVITYVDGKELPGSVFRIPKGADAASQTISVRIAVPNPQKMGYGDNVSVVFPSINIAGARP
jgi:RND family efflux transporter MFP subunit